ncbi:UPF0716 protein FxsA [Palleronia aestuarii]|uniref:UPF0716 protein FxsA n=1 Tax=Palleronia aestuarii TaxID=568105 RepID=A0A2W7QB51_9RHOB|nr:FxsA family protein [Palleronia aestuarii]PZX18979.1 UPF0716 protein FxsA [Palleronia aestuarii]
MKLLAAFIAIPLIEIALFIQVGGLLGLWPTLAIVLVTAIIGTTLVRSQGALALAELRRSLNDMRDPSEPLAHGAMILVAGVLLLTPGFFTDALGFALLVPAVRRAAFEFLRTRVKVQSFGPGAGPTRAQGSRPHSRTTGDGDVIEGEYDEVDIPEPDPNRRPSGWTRR